MRRAIQGACSVIAVALILIGIHSYRYRHVRHNSDLVKLLPAGGDLNLVYADLQALRQAQLLGLLANIKVATDSQYSAFLKETNFDYTRDLDAVAIGSDANRVFLLGRGRFDWSKLVSFAIKQNGKCDDAACRVPASATGRWVNLILLQPDVLGVAISPNPTGADELRPPGRRVQEEIPPAPIWIRPSHALLSRPASLPLPLQIFAIGLQSSDQVTVSAQKDRVQLKASFANAAAADTARHQLEIETKLIKAALKSEKPDQSSLAGLLMGGSFQVIGTDVLGVWPVSPELLKALQ